MPARRPAFGSGPPPSRFRCPRGAGEVRRKRAPVAWTAWSRPPWRKPGSAGTAPSPVHTTWLGPDRYDWDFADQTFGELKRRSIVPIADLCHFGVPDWIGDFQNPDFSRLFPSYARAFAERFPWVQLYTPVNEMFACATFSGLYGWWNEQLTTDRGFVTALKHIVRANVLAMWQIVDVRPDAIFIQSESSEYFHADNPEAIKPAELRNSRRFLSLDLNYGKRVDSEMYRYLLDNGMTAEEYDFFMANSLRRHAIMGNDYYVTNEHRVAPDGRTWASGDVFGYDEITRQYQDRYRLPIMHTETNLRQGTQAARRFSGCGSSGQMSSGFATAVFRPSVHLVLAYGPGRLGHGAA